MHSRVWMMLTCFCLGGCVGGQRQFRQSAGLGPGPGPGCASTLDCMCKNGSKAACEQMEASSKAVRTPKPSKPNSPKPGPEPVLPPTGSQPGELDEDTKDRCSAHYAQCVEAGGLDLPGHVFGSSRCASCLGYCTSNGFWPEAIYTWKGVRLPCPGI
jgi:hypothetical protein